MTGSGRGSGISSGTTPERAASLRRYSERGGAHNDEPAASNLIFLCSTIEERAEGSFKDAEV
jgi:hypothetical protein